MLEQTKGTGAHGVHDHSGVIVQMSLIHMLNWRFKPAQAGDADTADEYNKAQSAGR